MANRQIKKTNQTYNDIVKYHLQNEHFVLERLGVMISQQDLFLSAIRHPAAQTEKKPIVFVGRD